MARIAAFRRLFLPPNLQGLMSRIIYHNGFPKINWTTDVIRVLLERSTSTYTPDRDHPYLNSFTGGGGVEISVASYARQTLGTKTAAGNNAKDQFEFDCADVAFGNLEAGQTVKSLIVYRQVGGDDTTPANDELLLYDDGKIDLTLAANAALGATTIYVDPIEADIPSGTALNFGGGATCSTNAAASRGARSLSVTALAAAATAGAKSSNVATASILPAVLQNGPFTWQIHANGLFLMAQRGLFTP